MPLQVDFWNVGQGDASSIIWQNGRFSIIDVGPRCNSFIKWLAENPRFQNIADLILTHNDSDHVGGLEQLLELPYIRIQSAYVVFDRDRAKLKPLFEKLHNTAADFYRLDVRKYEIRKIVECNEFSLHVRCPDATMNYQKEKNETSGILSLVCNDHDLIVWGGDQKLEIVAQKTAETKVLFGPHHGAPQDKRGKYVEHLSKIQPSSCFVSTGTNNRYDHPYPEFIISANKTGSIVQCSQLTLRCGKCTRPICDGDAYYGLPTPDCGTPCHGHLRLHIADSGEIAEDELLEVHRAAIRASHLKPLCMP